MKIESVVYDILSKKWSAGLPTALDSERTLVIVVGPVDVVDQAQPLIELVRAFSRSFVIGCSSAGALEGTNVRDDVISVTIVQFAKTTMSLAQAAVSATTDAFTAGQQIAKRLSKPSLRGVIVFGDGLEVNGAELVRGLNSALDQSIALVGGLAGDGTRFKKTWVLAGPAVKNGLVAAVGLYGEHVVIAQSSRYGWKKVGPERTVTKSDGRIIYELDGRPALEVYEEAIAAASKAGGAVTPIMLPLAVRASARHDKSLVRSVLGVEAQKQCLRLAVDAPQGYLVQALVGEKPDLLSSAHEAGAATKESAAPIGSDALVLAISHAGRRAVLGADVSMELTSAIKGLPGGPTPHVAGLYGYGEIAAVAGGHSDLHNQSLSLAMIMESATPIARKATRGLAAGAARAQAPSSASGPAAHLRSRHQTVDDLFIELEIEGGKRGAVARPPGVPPPVPPRRSAAPIPSASSSSVAVAKATAEDPEESTSPAMRASDLLPAPSSEVRPSDVPEHTRSRVKTPRVVNVPEDLRASIGAPREPFVIRSVSYDPTSGRWSLPTMPELDSPNTLVLAFGTPTVGATTAPLDELARAFPSSHVIGCASGKLLRGTIVSGGELLVTIAKFGMTTLHTAWADLATGSFAAGAALGQQLLKPNLTAILVVGDGTAADGEALLGGLAGSVPSSVSLSGGLASSVGGRSWVMAGTTIRPGIAAAIGFYGNHLVVGRASRYGFDPFGPERKATRASGRTLYELDGNPALAVYAEYLGQKVSALTPGMNLPFPLSCRVPDRAEPFVRMPIAFDANAQSITFAGEIPPSATVRLMRSSHDRLLGEVRNAAAAAGKPLVSHGSDALVVAVSSIGRAEALGEDAEEESGSVLDGLPRELQAHVTGFYSVSELGATVTGKSEFTNDSFSLTCFTESARVVEQPVSDRRTIPAPSSHPAETPSPPQVARRSGRAPRPEITRAVVSGVGTAAGAANAKITRAKRGDINVVTFSGRLSESFKGDTLGRELTGVVVFDLGNVERITSFGVREWLQMLGVAADRVKKIYFAHCSEAVVNQLSMIRKFAGSAQVVSFFAPYLCDSCGEQFERLFDCELDADAIRSSDAPESVCQRCNGRGRFDDDPDTYLAFAPSHVGQPIPMAVRAVLQELAAAAPQPSVDAIEKTVEGELTRVRVHAKLGGAVRWQRILDGIEGALVVDLGGVGTLDEPGIANFEAALTALGPEVDSVRLERCPQQVLEHFAAAGTPRRVTITSTVLTGFCPSCNVQRPALLVADQHAHAIAAGREPTLNCKRCNGPLSLVEAGAVVQFLSRQRRRPSSAPRASTPPPAPVQGASPYPLVSQVPSPPSMMTSLTPPQPQSSSRGVLVGAAILSLAILTSAGFFAYARSHAGIVNEPAPPAKTSPAAPAWSAVADLPPPWVERPFVEENNVLLIVGRAEKAPTAEAALSQARNEAIGRVLHHLETDLAGSAVHDFLVARLKDDDARRRAPAVAERYLRQVGNFAQPDRGETVVRQREVGVEAFARYRLSRTSYAQALATYRATSSVQGMTVARVFPTLEAPSDSELVVIGVAKGRIAESAGVKVGDFVNAAASKPVTTVEAFGKLSDEWNAVPAGGTLDLDIATTTSKSVVKLKKPVPQPPVVVVPPPPPRREPPPPKPARELGIIPPPRNF